METRYSISDTAKQLEVEAHVLRYWEVELGLHIERNAQGHRFYTPDDVKLLLHIKDLKEQCAGLRCNEKYLFYYTQKRQGYIEMESMKEREIKLEYFTKESNFILVNNVIYYFGAREDSSYQDILYKYNLETGEQKKILEDYKVACSFLNAFMGVLPTCMFVQHRGEKSMSD